MHTSTGSTNDDIKALARSGASTGAIVLAEEQTAGRGRGGHRWHSPAGANLYLSCLLRPAIEAARAAPIALVVGLCVAQIVVAALPASSGLVAVKWPNDVLIGGRKIAGVLVEGLLKADVLHAVVVGVGLNVETLEFPAELAESATSLAREGAPREQRDRHELAAALVAATAAAVERFEREGLSPFLGELGLRDALRGKRVRVAELEGRADGVDDGGHLVLVQPDGTRVLAGGGHVELLSP